MKKFSVIMLVTILSAMVLLPNAVLADNNARDYIAAPVGLNGFAIYYNHSRSNELYTDGSSTSSDYNVESNIGLLRGVIWREWLGFEVDPQLIIPFGDVHVDGADAGGDFSGSGIGDPIILSSMWFVNDADSQSWFAITPYLTIPIGDYDHNEAINLGANRWAFKFEAGGVKGFGKFYVDLYTNVEVYGDNDDFGASKVKLEQDPLYTVETHFSYDVTEKFFVSADYYYHNGGETTVDGVDQDNEQNNHNVGVTFCYSMSSCYQLQVVSRHDVKVENGPETHTTGLRFFYFF